MVHDPFMGRGTTLIEAALLGRVPCGCDVSPLSLVLTRPRLRPPTLEQIRDRLAEIDFTADEETPEDLLVFFHPETLREIAALKKHLRDRGMLDAVDEWIALVALNRLTGHSAGFFSVYTLPPNQAVSIKSQRKINAVRHQTPSRRNVPELIYKKSRKLLQDCDGGTRARLRDAAEKERAAQPPRARHCRDSGRIGCAGGDVAAVLGRGGLRGGQLAALLVSRH